MPPPTAYLRSYQLQYATGRCAVYKLVKYELEYPKSLFISIKINRFSLPYYYRNRFLLILISISKSTALVYPTITLFETPAPSTSG